MQGEPITARITDNGGDTPRAASAIFYDLLANVPGVGVIEFPSIQPHNDRPPDTIDTQPVAVGKYVQGTKINQNVYWFIYEREAYGPCPGDGGRPGAPPLVRGRPGDPLLPPPPPPPPPGGGGSSSTPVNPGGGDA